MRHDKAKLRYFESRFRAAREHPITRTALEVTFPAMRAEAYREYLVNQAYLLFGADAGVGRHKSPEQLRAADQMRLVVAGGQSLPTADWVLTGHVARTHPGFWATTLVGTAQPGRLPVTTPTRRCSARPTDSGVCV